MTKPYLLSLFQDEADVLLFCCLVDLLSLFQDEADVLLFCCLVESGGGDGLGPVHCGSWTVYWCLVVSCASILSRRGVQRGHWSGRF